MNNLKCIVYNILFISVLFSCSSIQERKPSSIYDFANREFDSHKFAEEIVAQIEDDPSTAKKLDPKFFMSFDIENLESINTRGFQNLFSFDDSNGSPNYRKRTKTEIAMAGLPEGIGVGPKELRPKYTHVNFKGNFDTVFVEQYGTSIAQFRRETHTRSSFAFGDTLEGGTAFPASSIDESILEITDGQMSWGAGTDPIEGHIWGELSLHDMEYLFIKEDELDKNISQITKLSKKYGFGLKTYSPYSESMTQFQMKNIKTIFKAKEYQPYSGFIRIETAEELDFFAKIANGYRVNESIKKASEDILSHQKEVGGWGKVIKKIMSFKDIKKGRVYPEKEDNLLDLKIFKKLGDLDYAVERNYYLHLREYFDPFNYLLKLQKISKKKLLNEFAQKIIKKGFTNSTAHQMTLLTILGITKNKKLNKQLQLILTDNFLINGKGLNLVEYFEYNINLMESDRLISFYSGMRELATNEELKGMAEVVKASNLEDPIRFHKIVALLSYDKMPCPELLKKAASK